MGLLSKSALLGLSVGVLGLIIGLSPVGLSLEERFGLDILFTLRGSRKPPDSIVVVSIDKESSNALNLNADFRKWPRSVHARLVDVLSRQGASAIVFDVVFADARLPGDDEELANSIKAAGNVVLGCFLRAEKMPIVGSGGKAAGGLQLTELVLPIPSLCEAAAAAAPFPLPKVPSQISQYWTFKTSAGDTPTLPVVALQVSAMNALEGFFRLMRKSGSETAVDTFRAHQAAGGGLRIEALVRELRTIFEKDPSLPDRMLGQLEGSGLKTSDPSSYAKIRSLIRMYGAPNSQFLNFYGPPRTITTVPLHAVVSQRQGATDAGSPVDFKGKTVFVGHAPRVQYEQQEGFLTVFSLPDGLDIAGVEIAATAYGNLVEDRHTQPVGVVAHAVILFLWGLAITMASRILRTWTAVSVVVGAALFYLAATEYEFVRHALWYPTITPLFVQLPLGFLGAFLWKYVDANKERKTIREALQRYLPNDAVDRLTKSSTAFHQAHRLVYGICLWTDAEQYTTLSERLTPEELAAFMNRYFEIIFNPVKRHGGIISNVIGDSVLAIWAAPSPDAQLRRKACAAALDIGQAIEEANRSSSLPLLPTRIGIHSGHIAIGNVGAMDHYEYRPIGDIVNTATRIEGLNKVLGTRMLASKEVVNDLEGILTRHVGTFLPVGKSNPLALYELVMDMDQAKEHHLSGCALFEAALEAFRSRRWHEAMEKFEASMQCFGRDMASQYYIGLCRLHESDPPDETWDGTIRMDRK